MEKHEIVSAMANVVANVMTDYQMDFTKYDKPYVESKKCCFPLIWVVSKMHTDLLRLGEYEADFNRFIAIRNAYGKTKEVHLAHSIEFASDSDHIFLITKDSICEITKKAALEAIRDIALPVIQKWEEEHGEIKPQNVPRVLNGISLGHIKKLAYESEKFGPNSLMAVLNRLKNWNKVSDDHRIEIYYNQWYNEFSFVEKYDGKIGITGGIIFHGTPETGYQKNFAVQISPCYGWAMHT